MKRTSLFPAAADDRFGGRPSTRRGGITTMTQRILIALIAAALCRPGTVSAQSTNLFTEDLSAFNASQILGDGSTYGAVIIAAPTPFNDGDALRMYDFNAGAKPELQGDLPSALLQGFQIDFQSLDQSTISNESSAIRFRMANNGLSISSSARSAFSLSWHADGTFTASYDTGTGSVSTIRSAQLLGVHDITMVANGTTNLMYSYTLFSTPRTLDPLSYDVFLDGVLFNDTGTFTNIPSTGLPFSDVAEYTPGAGIQRFGLTGSSNADTDPDVWFDNIVLTPLEILPAEAEITSFQFVASNGLSFGSETGTTYALQWTTNSGDEFIDWFSTGAEVEGDGTTQVLFDPAGFSTGKTYRVIEAQ